MLRFRRMTTLQECAAVDTDVHNHFNLDRRASTVDRSGALTEWQNLTA
jgi:hypothetical protein